MKRLFTILIAFATTTICDAQSGTTSLCVGTTTTLSYDTTTGVWSSSDTTIATVDSLTGIVTGIWVGTGTITYTFDTSYFVTPIIVKETVSAILASDSIFCLTQISDSSLILLDSALYGTWMSSNISVASISDATGTIVLNSPGVDTIRYSTGCGTPATKVITVYMPVATITVTQPDCSNLFRYHFEATSVTDGLGDWVHCRWAFPDGWVIPDTIRSLDYEFPTEYTSWVVTLIDSVQDAHQCIARDSVILNIFPFLYSDSLFVSDTLLCKGAVDSFWGPLEFNGWGNTPVLFEEYSWHFGDGIILNLSGSNITAHIYTATGNYSDSLFVTNEFGCRDTVFYSDYWAGSLPPHKYIHVGGPSGGFTATPEIGCAPLAVLIRDINIDSFSIYRRLWTFNASPSMFTTGAPPMYPLRIYGADTTIVFPTGVYHVILNDTDIAGCAIQDTLTIYSNPSVVPESIHGDSVFCIADTSTLSDSVLGGRWRSTNIGVAKVDSITGLITALSAGIDTIIYHGASVCDTAVVSKTVSIVPVPYVGTITGDTSVCPGSSIILTEITTGGNWHLSDSMDAMVSDGVVTGISAGLDTVFYSFSNICGIAIVHHVITINPLPSAGTIIVLDSFCNGASTTLVATATGGIWRSTDNSIANVTDTGLVWGVSPGTDTIVYKITNSCGVDSVSKRLIIKPLPHVSVITGIDSVCKTHTITLADSVSGGNWYVVNNNAAISVSGVVTGANHGMDTVLYLVSNFCGTDTARQIILVKPLPFAGTITGADSVCPGRFILLSDSITGGVWATTNYNARVRKDSVFGVTPGIDTIEYAVVNSCGSDIATYSVIISHEPYATPITGSDSICVGHQITLSDATTSGVWSVANTNISLIADIATGIAPGTDVISYTVSNSCGHYSATLNVRIISPVVVALTGNGYVCVGKTDTLIGSPAGGNWSVSDTNVSMLSGVLTDTLPGKDTIFYVVPNFCGLMKDSISITIYTDYQCDSINEIHPISDIRNIIVYPNPAGNWIAIEGANGYKISVVNLFGQVVRSFTAVKDLEIVNIEGLVNGMYLVKVVGSDGVWVVRKVVKM